MHSHRITWIAFFTLLGGAAIILFVKQFSYPPGWDFRNNLWGPAHLLVSGQSAYNIDLLFDGSNAVWLPQIIGLLFPLGWLSLQHASNLWWGINLTAMLALIWISTGKARPRPLRLALVLLLSFLFPSVITHFDLGQISILITLIYLVVAIYGEKMSNLALTLFLLLALTKPQLGLLVIPGLFTSFLRERGQKETIGLIGWMSLLAIFLTLPLFISNSQWLIDLVTNLQRNPDWAHASLQIWLTTALGNIGLILWLLVIAIGMWLNIRIWRDYPKREAVVRSLAMTPLLTPYIWSWDFVLVIPLLVEFAFRIRSRGGLLLFGVGYFLCIGFFVGLRLSADLPEAYFWWVPWLLVGMVFVVELSMRRRSAPERKTLG